MNTKTLIKMSCRFTDENTPSSESAAIIADLRGNLIVEARIPTSDHSITLPLIDTEDSLEVRENQIIYGKLYRILSEMCDITIDRKNKVVIGRIDRLSMEGLNAEKHIINSFEQLCQEEIVFIGGYAPDIEGAKQIPIIVTLKDLEKFFPFTKKKSLTWFDEYLYKPNLIAGVKLYDFALFIWIHINHMTECFLIKK